MWTCQFYVAYYSFSSARAAFYFAPVPLLCYLSVHSLFMHIFAIYKCPAAIAGTRITRNRKSRTIRVPENRQKLPDINLQCFINSNYIDSSKYNVLPCLCREISIKGSLICGVRLAKDLDSIGDGSARICIGSFIEVNLPAISVLVKSICYLLAVVSNKQIQGKSNLPPPPPNQYTHMERCEQKG